MLTDKITKSGIQKKTCLNNLYKILNKNNINKQKSFQKKQNRHIDINLMINKIKYIVKSKNLP